MIWDILLYILLFAVLAAGGFVGYVLLQSHLSGSAKPGSFFGPKPEKRLDVVEQWNLDARRRLVLIRRDNVEHLIMTGGPVDVVIETGIGEQPRRGVATSEPVYQRPTRPLGSPSPAQSPAVAPAAPSLNGTKAE